MKKGFTLVELLAVLVILSVLIFITTIAVNKVVTDSKNKLNNIQKKLVLETADVVLVENMGKILSIGSYDGCVYINFEDLITHGYIDREALNAFTDEELEDEVIVFTNWYSKQGETDFITMLGSELGEPPEEYCTYLY